MFILHYVHEFYLSDSTDLHVTTVERREPSSTSVSLHDGIPHSDETLFISDLTHVVPLAITTSTFQPQTDSMPALEEGMTELEVAFVPTPTTIGEVTPGDVVESAMETSTVVLVTSYESSTIATQNEEETGSTMPAEQAPTISNFEERRPVLEEIEDLYFATAKQRPVRTTMLELSRPTPIVIGDAITVDSIESFTDYPSHEQLEILSSKVMDEPVSNRSLSR